jgi:hypothetical protein
MHLLFETHDYAEIQSTKVILESRGIVVFIGNEASARSPIVAVSVQKFALYIVLENQIQDAISLLKNEDHNVTTGVDITEYYQTFAETQPDSLSLILKVSAYCAAVFVGLIVAFSVYMES